MPDLELEAIEREVAALRATFDDQDPVRRWAGLAETLLAAVRARNATLHRLRLVLAEADEARERPAPSGPVMVRPSWEEMQRLSGAYVLCACRATLQTHEAVREHWQRGHFDYVQQS